MPQIVRIPRLDEYIAGPPINRAPYTPSPSVQPEIEEDLYKNFKPVRNPFNEPDVKDKFEPPDIDINLDWLGRVKDSPIGQAIKFATDSYFDDPINQFGKRAIETGLDLGGQALGAIQATGESIAGLASTAGYVGPSQTYSEMEAINQSRAAQEYFSKRIREEEPENPLDYIQKVWQIAGDYERERPEDFAGQKFLKQAPFDVTNLIGSGIGAKQASRLIAGTKKIIESPEVGAAFRKAALREQVGYAAEFETMPTSEAEAALIATRRLGLQKAQLEGNTRFVPGFGQVIVTKETPDILHFKDSQDIPHTIFKSQVQPFVDENEYLAALRKFEEEPESGVRPPSNVPDDDAIPPDPAKKEFWTRPKDNAFYLSTGFKDDLFRKANALPGNIDHAFINPSALADEPVSRGYLVFRRLEEIGESGVNGGMSFLRRMKDPFQFDANDNVTNVPGFKGDIGTLAEFFDKNKSKLNSDQQKYIETVNDLLKDALKLARENKVPLKELRLPEGQNYIHHLVREVRKIKAKDTSDIRKMREYDTFAEGILNGVKYERRLDLVVEDYISQVYRSVAYKRFHEMVDPLGETAKQRVIRKSPQLYKDYTDAVSQRRNANQVMGAINRAARGEQLPASLIASIAKHHPQQAQLLKLMGPKHPQIPILKDLIKNEIQQAKHKNFQARQAYSKKLQIEMEPHIEPEEGTVPMSGFQGKVFPKDTADFLKKRLGDHGQDWLRSVNSVSTGLRTVQTTIDVAAPFIQGLPVLGYDPAAWAKGVKNQYVALLINPRVRQQMYAQNEDVVKEMISNGGILGGSDYTEELRGVFKNPFVGRFQEAFATYQDTAAIELWKSLSPIYLQRGESLTDLARLVNTMTGRISTKSLGIGATQRQLEGAFLLYAPRFTRAGFSLVGMAAQGGIAGDVARRALAGMAGSMAVLFAAGTMASGTIRGESWDKIQRDLIDNLQPIRNGRFNSRFMTFRVGDDHVGFGSFFYSLIRLVGSSYASMANRPEDFAKLDSQDNPLLSYWRSRTSPIMGDLWTIATRETYFGEPLDTLPAWGKAVAAMIAPQWAEAYLLSDPPSSAASAPAIVSGLRSFPQSYAERRDLAREDVIRETLPDRDFPVRPGTSPERVPTSEEMKVVDLDPRVFDLKEKAIEKAGKRNPSTEEELQTNQWHQRFDTHKANREVAAKDIYHRFDSGYMSGEEFMGARSKIMQDFSSKIDGLSVSYPKALITREAQEAFKAEQGIDILPKNPNDVIADKFFNIEEQNTGDPDKDKKRFYKERKDFLAQYTPDIQSYIQNKGIDDRFEDPIMKKVEREVQKARQILEPYYELPDQVKEEIPALASIIDEIDALPEDDPMKIFASRNPAVQLYNKILTQKRTILRLTHPELNQVGIKYLGWSVIPPRL